MQKQEMGLDALKEVIHMGTANAATALSEILNQKVMINVPDAKLIPLNQVAKHLGGASTPIIGVYFLSSGELISRILLIFDQETGHKLASVLTGDNAATDKPLTDIEKSSIMEVGNIVANSYINTLANLFNIRLFPSVPYYAEDMLGAVIDFLLIEISEVADYSLMLDTEMHIESFKLRTNLVIFPDEKFLNRLFEKLNITNLQEK